MTYICNRTWLLLVAGCALQLITDAFVLRDSLINAMCCAVLRCVYGGRGTAFERQRLVRIAPEVSAEIEGKLAQSMQSLGEKFCSVDRFTLQSSTVFGGQQTS